LKNHFILPLYFIEHWIFGFSPQLQLLLETNGWIAETMPEAA